ncbi:MAG: hypothetical protein IJX17_07715 [Clostridia bacterium]|nr:hypothetical protein [Clostridia bacterium]
MENIKNNNSFIKNFNLKSIVFAILLCLMLFTFTNINTDATFYSEENSKYNLETTNINKNKEEPLFNKECFAEDTMDNTPCEIEPYAEKEDDKNKYYEDKSHMVYFAVYFVDFVPGSKKEDFTIQTMFLAPQKSSPAMEYDKNKALSSNTVCKLTYAEKEFYIYDDGAIAHYREFKRKNAVTEIPIDMPKAEIISASADYKYIGYDYDRTTTLSKYKSTTLLPGAKDLNGIDGTSIKATQKSNNYDHLYNITISFYFYKPSKLVLNTKNENFGRFSENPDSTFEKASSKINLTLQEGLKIQIDNFTETNPNLIAKVTGTKTYITDGVLYSKPINLTYYIILNEYCHLKSKIPYEYFHNKGYILTCSFTQDVFDLSFTINTNLTHSENLNIFISYEYLNKKFTLENGTNLNTKVTLEDMPAGIKSSIVIHLSAGKGEYHYIISKTPLTSLLKKTELTSTIEAYNEFTLDKDTEFNEINCYIYELYQFNIVSRTDQTTSLLNEQYKINGVDLALQTESSIKIDGFKFIGYSLEESSTDIVNILTENDNVTLYANWKKELCAILHYNENYITLPDFDYGKHSLTKVLYNFDTDNTLLIDSLPEFDQTYFIGYTKNLENYNEIVNFEINDTLYDGDIYYAVYKYKYSFKYDLSKYNSEIENNSITINGTLPEEQTGYSYKIVYGLTSKPAKFIVTDFTLSKLHYDFLGWSLKDNYYTSDYNAGDEILISSGDFTLYPILERHAYNITINLNGGKYIDNNHYDSVYDEQNNTVTFKTYNDEVFDFPESNIKKDGYILSKITASKYPEKLSNNNYYREITEDETINIEWEITRYKVNITLDNEYIPSLERNFDVKVSYTYYDELLKSIIYKEEVLNTSNNNISEDILMGTNLKVTASIEKEGFNLAFYKVANEENKTCTLDYISKGDGHYQEIKIVLTRVYKIHLIRNGLTSGNEHEIVYKPFSQKFTLPTLTGERDGYYQTHWNTSDDGTGKDYSNYHIITANTNEEMTLYAIWSKYVKYYFTYPIDLTTICYTKSKNENDVYSAIIDKFNFAGQSVVKDGITYYLAGFSSSPTGTTIEYDGKTDKVFKDSVSWYAVYSTMALTYTINENVDVKFHLNSGDIIEKNINRTITYSNYNTYFNYDFKVQENDLKNAKITYTNDTLEFINDTVNNYMIYGWNNTGNYLKPFFTKDEEIIVENAFDFYPIYRTINYDESNLEHKFYFTVNNPIIRYSTIYTLSNTFYVTHFDFSEETKITDTLTYEPIYGKLTFDSLSNQNPHSHQARYYLLGWGITQYAYNARWQSGEIEVSKSTSWYAVWRITDNGYLPQETLTHTFYLSDTNFITKTTTLTKYFINKITIQPCDRTMPAKIENEGEIISIAGSDLEYVNLITNSNFYAWASQPNSTDVSFRFGQTLNPQDSMNFYPIYKKYFNIQVTYSCEDRLDIATDIKVPVYISYDQSTIKSQYTGENNYEYTIDDFDWTHSNDKFLGWSYALNKSNDNEENSLQDNKIYQAGDIVLIENLTDETFFNLIAILKQPELFTITYVINEIETEKLYLEGDIIELIDPQEIEGKVFKHWSVENKVYNSGDIITISSNTEIIAVYVDENNNKENNNNDSNNNDSNNNENINNQNSTSQNAKKTKTGIIVLIVILSIVIISAGVVSIVIILKKKRK